MLIHLIQRISWKFRSFYVRKFDKVFFLCNSRNQEIRPKMNLKMSRENGKNKQKPEHKLQYTVKSSNRIVVNSDTSILRMIRSWGQTLANCDKVNSMPITTSNNTSRLQQRYAMITSQKQFWSSLMFMFLEGAFFYLPDFFLHWSRFSFYWPDVFVYLPQKQRFFLAIWIHHLQVWWIKRKDMILTQICDVSALTISVLKLSR